MDLSDMVTGGRYLAYGMEASDTTSHFDEGGTARKSIPVVSWCRKRMLSGSADGLPDTQRILSGIRLTWGVWSRWHARDKDLLAPRLGAKTGGGTIHE